MPITILLIFIVLLVTRILLLVIEFSLNKFSQQNLTFIHSSELSDIHRVVLPIN